MYKNSFITDKPGSMAMERLSGAELLVFNTLKKAVTDIIEGRTSSTVVPVPFRPELEENVGFDLNKNKQIVSDRVNLSFVMYCIRMECPYELCWYNELRAAQAEKFFDIVKGNHKKDFFLKLHASPDYEGEDTFTVNRQKIKEAWLASEKAMQIVNENKDFDDGKKLENYYKYLEGRGERGCIYDEGGKKKTSGDNYQMITLFNDEVDPVVCCSGYTKAFRYLCELSDFENVSFYMVAGRPEGRGNHMWNIFSLDGEIYMTDPTWRIYMPEVIESSEEQCTVSKGEGGKLTYVYEKNTRELYGGRLNVGGKVDSAWDPVSADMPQIEVTDNKDGSKTVRLTCLAEGAEIYYSVLEPNPDLLADADEIRNREKPYEGPFTLKDAGGYYITATAKTKTASEEETDSWSKTNSISVWVVDHSCGDNLTWEMDRESGILSISGTGKMSDFRMQQAPWYPYIKEIRHVVCSPGVESIGKCAFWWCTSLKDVRLPGSVSEIGVSAFDTCSSLKEIRIGVFAPDTLSDKLGHAIKVHDKAFEQCSSLETFVYEQVYEKQTE